MNTNLVCFFAKNSGKSLKYIFAIGASFFGATLYLGTQLSKIKNFMWSKK